MADQEAPHSDDTPNTKTPPHRQTRQEAGSKGGRKVSARYGPEFFRAIGKKGGRATKERHGTKFFGDIGKKGGRTTSERHGKPFFEEIGKKGGQRVKELIERAKAEEDAGGPSEQEPGG